MGWASPAVKSCIPGTGGESRVEAISVTPGEYVDVRKNKVKDTWEGDDREVRLQSDLSTWVNSLSKSCPESLWNVSFNHGGYLAFCTSSLCAADGVQRPGQWGDTGSWRWYLNLRTGRWEWDTVTTQHNWRQWPCRRSWRGAHHHPAYCDMEVAPCLHSLPGGPVDSGLLALQTWWVPPSPVPGGLMCPDILIDPIHLVIIFYE